MEFVACVHHGRNNHMESRRVVEHVVGSERALDVKTCEGRAALIDTNPPLKSSHTDTPDSAGAVLCKQCLRILRSVANKTEVVWGHVSKNTGDDTPGQWSSFQAPQNAVPWTLLK